MQEEQGSEVVEPPSNDNVNADTQSNGATIDNRTTPKDQTKTAPATFQKVRQPPGGVSSGLW